MSDGDTPLHEAVSAFKRRLVLDTLTANGGNRSRTAAVLRIARTSLLRIIRELEISALLPDGRRGRPRVSGRRAGGTKGRAALRLADDPKDPGAAPRA